ncbi:glycoside hydrolase family 43 protein [Plantibacter flavus]|uniref:glycoside hydrolase family 43 protein n=1 Tax=Plantibacter flavus TaxID=150123 RepID=UPI003F167993
MTTNTPDARAASASITATTMVGTRMGSGASEPILPGFHPDPSICRVGHDYYLATSSFEYFPGVPLFHSTDLVSWTQIGHVLSRRNQFRRGDPSASLGIYAGTLRHHAGRFWYITTNMSDYFGGQLIVSAEEPVGPWTDPIFVPGALGIDPDLAWDDEGTCYLTWKDFAIDGILQSRLDLDSGELLDDPYPVWQGSGLDAPEGPHLYEISGTWYLMLAEGGTERGHAVTIARSSHPAGPFEPHPENPVFSRRSLVSSPVQNVGHADLVEGPDGRWSAVYLGVRARGSTPGFHVIGRETFLAGIDWVDGWPSFDVGAYDVPRAVTAFVDDFDAERLHDRWVTPGGEPQHAAALSPRGGVDLANVEDSSGLLCVRVRDLRWSAEAVVEAAGRFLLRLDDRHWYGLIVDEGAVRAVAQLGDITHELGSIALGGASVTVRIEAVDPRRQPAPLYFSGPDDIVLSVVDEDRVEHELGRMDGRYVSTEVAGGFTGRMLAVGATAEGGRLLSVAYTPR